MRSMETADREQLVRLLKSSRKMIVDAAEGLTEEQAKMRPGDDRWSVLECVEHVGLVEDRMFAAVTTKLTPAEPPEDRAREQVIIRGATDRTRKFAAPEGVKPAGKFSTLAEALAHFETSRARTIAYIERCEHDLRSHTIEHPALGHATGQEFALVLALHPARHALQILETREALGLD
jgi:DinB superfamily